MKLIEITIFENTNMIVDGAEIVFVAPCNSSEVSGLKLLGASNVFDYTLMFKDANGNDLSEMNNLFKQGAYVKVLLNITDSIAYIQNANTNGYIEGKFIHIEADNISVGSRKSSSTIGLTSSTFGTNCEASGDNSFAQGTTTVASSENSHAEGYNTKATNTSAHSEGRNTTASGDCSHVEGLSSTASGKYSHAEGNTSKAIGDGTHAEGYRTNAMGTYSHAEGTATNILPSNITSSSANSAILSTFNTTAFSLAKGEASHVEGSNCLALANYSHAEGYYSKSIGSNSHAEGANTKSIGDSSHAEGYRTTAMGTYSHAEGNSTNVAPDTITSSTANSNIESTWSNTKFSLAKNISSHVEGIDCLALGDYSHAEGNRTKAIGSNSHAEGSYTIARGTTSHAEGSYTEALVNQHAQGHYNDTSVASSNSTTGTSTGTAFVIGNGTYDVRSNAFRVTGAGVTYAKGSYNSTGADYAEFAEWADGNPNNEDRRGYFVTFDETKTAMIRKANAGDYILGIVSGNPCIIGNSDESWLGRYVFDEFGSIVYEETEVEVETFDEETGTNLIKKETVTMYKINPDYDKTREYVHREKRKEWSAVGWIGVLSVRDDGTCVAGGYCVPADGGIATHSERVAGAYRVLERISDNIIKVALK